MLLHLSIIIISIIICIFTIKYVFNNLYLFFNNLTGEYFKTNNNRILVQKIDKKNGTLCYRFANRKEIKILNKLNIIK